MKHLNFMFYPAMPSEGTVPVSWLPLIIRLRWASTDLLETIEHGKRSTEVVRESKTSAKQMREVAGVEQLNN